MNSNPPLSCSSIHIAPFLDLNYKILFNNGTHSGLSYHIDIEKLDKILNNKIIDIYSFDKTNINKIKINEIL